MTDLYVYGLHAVKALLSSTIRKTYCLYLSSERRDKPIEALSQLALAKKIPVETLTRTEMSKRFPDQVHQGVIAKAGSVGTFGEQGLRSLLEKAKKPALILILDGITDPHNLGACLRTADAAGVDFVVIPKDKNASLTAVVTKVASGAVEALPLVRVTNLVRAMEILKEAGVWIFGADAKADQSLYTLTCTSPLALVMGAEGAGLRRLTKEHCDGLFSLPMSGSVESLNVSVATGIALYEVGRQRMQLWC